MASLVAAAPAPAAAPPFYLPINGVLHELVCVGKEVGHEDDLYQPATPQVGPPGGSERVGGGAAARRQPCSAANAELLP